LKKLLIKGNLCFQQIISEKKKLITFFFTKTIKVEFLNIFNFKKQLHKLILSINCSSKNIETSLNEKNKKLRIKLVNFDIFIKHFDRYMYSTIKKTFKKAKNTFFFAVDSV
jgi:hypothetical protein